PSWSVIIAVMIYVFLSMIIFKGYFLGMSGNYYLMTNRLEKAIMMYEMAVKHNTGNVKALYNYANILLHEKRTQEAIKLLEKAMHINSDVFYDKNIRLSLASCKWINGEIDEAIDILEELKKLYDYVNPSALTTLGFFYFLKGDNEKALENTNKAIKDNDSHAPAWDNLGQIYYKEKNYDEAEKSFLKALELKPKMVDSNFYLGCVYEEKGDTENAKKYFLAANECNISAMNTVSAEEVREKAEKYR
ncbi:MAG: tetratricopeptide repeat protein, partial [Firmicutes bacterium]|nr:tetratricopeptide repeat protein [Bacillota bacterium]